MPHPLEEHYRSVSDQLRSLEPIFDESEHGKNYRGYFREFLEVNELELALHAVCDFLLERGPAVFDEEIIHRVDSLHQQMSIHDDCTTKLTQLRNTPNTPSS